ncbi:hypothetical protein [Micromonospora sp. NPDC049497]|uniref:hypothetical protein n=1 Tax=Micromonospora sp. NPDC049497 TaxID=3364273 RepID=UPI0037B61459
MRETIERALRRQRVVVVVAVVAGVLWGVLGTLADRGATGAFVALAPILLWLGYWGHELFRSPSRTGLRVAPEQSAFFAPPRWPVTLPVVMTAWLPLQLVTYSARWGRDAFWWFLLVVTAVAVAIVVREQWLRLPLVEITPDGVGYGWPRRTVFVPWAAMDRDGPLWATQGDTFLRLPLVRPDLVRRSRLARRRAEQRFRVRNVDVAPVFLAAAVRHYARHPEHRTGIGTREEYARLCRTLTGGD